MPYDPETGEWVDDERVPVDFVPDDAPTDYGDEQASYSNPPEQPQSYSPTSEAEFRRASMPFRGPPAPHLAPELQPGTPRVVGYYDQRGAPVDFAPNESPQRFNQAPAMMDPTGRRPMSPEERLAQAEAQLAAVTPSHAESLQMSRLSNADAAVQSQIANGTITPQAGMQARALINQQLQPLMVRRSQIPMYMARARYQALQMQTAQRAAIMQETARFNAMGAQDRLISVRRSDGRMVDLLEDRQGHFTALDDIGGRAEVNQGQRAQAMQQQQQTRFDRLHREALADVRREHEAYLRTNNPGPRPEWYNRAGQDGTFRYSPEAAEAEARRRAEARSGGPSPAAQQQRTQPQGATVAPQGSANNAAPSRADQLRELNQLFASAANPPPPAPPPPTPPRNVMPFGSQQPGYIGGR